MNQRPRFPRWHKLLWPLTLALAFLAVSFWALVASRSQTAAGALESGGGASSPSSTATLTATVHLPFVSKDFLHLDWGYKGASLAGYWHDAYASRNAYAIVDYLHGVGANSVAVVASWYQETPASMTLNPDPLKTPTDSSLEAIIDTIHSLSMTVLLKPHVEVQTGEWRARIQPGDLEAWFDSFTAFILHYARIAEDHDVELFCVGTEMVSLTNTEDKRQRWADLVEQVREVYSGKVTYSAHEREVLGSNPLPPSFWADFDYAATTVYYSLSEATAPSLEELLRAWPAYGEELDAWQAEHHKPVILGEIGYRSLAQCAHEPWAWGGLSCDLGDSVTH